MSIENVGLMRQVTEVLEATEEEDRRFRQPRSGEVGFDRPEGIVGVDLFKVVRERQGDRERLVLTQRDGAFERRRYSESEVVELQFEVVRRSSESLRGDKQLASAYTRQPREHASHLSTTEAVPRHLGVLGKTSRIVFLLEEETRMSDNFEVLRGHGLAG